MGLGNRRCRASSLLGEAFRVSDRLKRAHSPGHAEGGGQHHFSHRQGHRVPVTHTGFSAQSGAVVVEATQLKKMLGLNSVNYTLPSGYEELSDGLCL